jgi:hypothetical protein
VPPKKLRGGGGEQEREIVASATSREEEGGGGEQGGRGTVGRGVRLGLGERLVGGRGYRAGGGGGGWWWEGVFAKGARGYLQNDINTEFLLLRVEINLSEGFICKINECGCCTIWTCCSVS